jgi:hypothetical protein
MQIYRLMDANLPVVNNPTNDIKLATGREPTTIEQWTAQVGGAFK